MPGSETNVLGERSPSTLVFRLRAKNSLAGIGLHLYGADLVLGDFGDGVKGGDGQVVDVLIRREVEVPKYNARGHPIGDNRFGDHLAAPRGDPDLVRAV